LLVSLQDAHGLNVNLVLWCVWTSMRFAEADSATLKRAIMIADEWEKSVVAPLRGVRRRLKEFAGLDLQGKVENVMESVKTAELASECALQERLEAFARSTLAPEQASAPEQRARRALAAYARQAGAARTAGFSVALLEKVIGLTIGDGTSRPD